MIHYAFSARPGSPLSDEEARRYGPEIIRLHESEGRVTWRTIKEASRDPKSILHEFVFNLSPEEAAEEHYSERARLLSRSIMVRFPDTQEPVRAFPSFKMRSHEEREYIPADIVVQDLDLTVRQLDKFRRQIRALLREYQAWRKVAGFEEAEVLLKAAEEFLRRAA